MTTIATDGQSIAADGRATVNGIISSDSQIKVYKLPGNRAVGFAGEAVKALAILDAMKRDEDITGLDFEGVYLLIIDGTAFVQSYEECPRPLAVPVPYSIGSGREIALGAMDAGKSPKEAVTIATKRDVYSGGKIRTVTLKAAPV